MDGEMRILINDFIRTHLEKDVKVCLLDAYFNVSINVAIRSPDFKPLVFPRRPITCGM